MKYWKNIFVASIAILLISLACDKEDIKENESTAPAFLTVRMHDTVGPYAHVNVHIVGVSIHLADSNDTNWTAVNVNPGMYDLLELQNGVDTVLVNQSIIDPGYVTQMRLLLGDSNHVVLTDSSVHELKVPSGQQTGVKINLNHIFEPLTAYEVTFDFDVNKSVNLKGNGEYQLKPVIKVESIEEI